MRSIVAAAIVATFVYHPLPTKASDKAGKFEDFGVGTNSCGTWFANKQTPSFVSNDQQWVLGYVTSYGRFNFTGSDISAGTDNAGLYAAVDAYCAAHPLESMASAAESLIADLVKKAGLHPSPRARVPNAR